MTAIRLLFSLCLLTIIYSCGQKPSVDNTDLQNQNIDALIVKGTQFAGANIDSVLPVSLKLISTGNKQNNKTALVYGEMLNAQYYWLSSDHKHSMEVAVQALADAEKYNIKKALPQIYLIIGNLHKENTNYKMAFNAQEKGLYWAKLNHDTAEILSLMNLRAMFIHTSRNLPHNDTAFADTSVRIHLAALKIAESNPKFEKRSIALYDNISQFYLNSRDYNKAIKYGEKGAQMAIKYDQQRSLTYSYSWLGQANYFKGDHAKGLSYLNKALQISKAIKAPFREMEIYGHMADCYKSSGDYKTALTLSNRSNKMSDSLKVLGNEKQMGELQIKYETAKKDAEIALLGKSEKEKNRQIILVFGTSLLFIVLLIVLIFQYRILRRRNVAMRDRDLQKDKVLENIAYIQAHELRKPLASILGLIDVIKVSDYEVDKETIAKLEEASHQLDSKIRSIIDKTQD